jgi:hypothetical protein
MASRAVLVDGAPLYLAMALILSGEILGKGLLFVSAVPS